jgi:hypothetical protein
MKINMKGGSVTIGGRIFKGRDISINNGKVTIDGKDQYGDLVGDINIEVHGDVESIENSSGQVTAVKVGSISTASGDVECGDVSGSVSTMSGDVGCGFVSGSVSTMSGDINQETAQEVSRLQNLIRSHNQELSSACNMGEEMT